MNSNSDDQGGRKIEFALSELIKKGLLTGLGALYMTEEGARSMLSEVKLPKEAAQFLVGQMARSKEEVMAVVAKEIRSFLESSNLAEEFMRVLSSTAFEINTTVRFVTKDGAIRPETQTKVNLKNVGSPKKKRK